MSIKAVLNSRFRLWLAAISFICLGIGLWFLWDGFFTYPKQRERALAYQHLEEEEQIEQWEVMAGERGWSTDNPGDPKSMAEIYFQRVLGILAIPPGLLYLYFLFSHLNRWVELEGAEIRTSWRQQIEISTIETLDKTKWKSKGIARIHYLQDGQKHRMVLDDWKYETKATREIVREIESRIDPSKIIGGPPESPIQEEDDNEGSSS